MKMMPEFEKELGELMQKHKVETFALFGVTEADHHFFAWEGDLSKILLTAEMAADTPALKDVAALYNETYKN